MNRKIKKNFHWMPTLKYLILRPRQFLRCKFASFNFNCSAIYISPESEMEIYLPKSILVVLRLQTSSCCIPDARVLIQKTKDSFLKIKTFFF